jgi:cytoskeletal protein RodZ
MLSIGETLRSERLRRGLSLEQLAAETKIRTHLLEAMEQDHLDALPSGLLARSFLRQYSRALGLNEDEMIASFKQQFDPPANRLPEPPPQVRSWQRSRSAEALCLLAAVSICVGAYSLWQERQRISHTVAVVAAGSRPASSLSAPDSMRDRTPKLESRSGVESENRATPALPLPGATGLPPVADNREQAVRAAFTATEPVWLSIKSDGTETYRGILEERQGKQFDASRRMTVLVGNAGGLEVSLNGRPVGPIGKHGQVELLLLTPDGAHIVPRTSDTTHKW